MNSPQIEVRLVPFEMPSGQAQLDSNPQNEKIELRATVNRKDQSLHIEYRLQGEIGLLEVPAMNPQPQRKDQLWEHTCFEAFLCQENESCYWELNASPSGDWNLYRFDRYRVRSLETHHVTLPTIDWDRSSSNVLKAKVQLDVSDLFQNISPDVLLLGLTAVIERKDHSHTYWAIRHCGDQPDFHLRQSFLLRL
jgi:hypothetical protein